MRFGKMILLALGMSLAVYAAGDPFVGKWNLNVEKSKYHPGPAPKSETVTIGEDHTVKVNETDANDKPVSWSYGMAEGKTAPITGMGAGSSVIAKQTGNTVAHTWNMNGKTSTGKGVISKDGKTMTYRIKGTGQDGKPMNNVLILEKEQ
ncbi:MAG: hypothetical protein M3Z09_11380 [Acidobacteriota bacterium]|nr:hypothetical protein [Acidobacteriota bacterium]